MKTLGAALLILPFICHVQGTVTINTPDGFKITSPGTGTVTFNRITDTAIVCEVALSNSDDTDPVTLTKVELFLSPNNGLTGAISDPIAFTGGAPTAVPASADGTTGKGLTTGMTANVKVLDGTKCAAYNHLCIKVSWGTKEATQCVTPIATNCAGCDDPETLPTKLKYKTSAPTYPIADTTSVEFECETGYTLAGTNPAVCTGNTFTLPTCTGCADPGTLSTGLKYKGDAPTYPIDDKTEVEFECDEGHTLDGTNPAVCTGNTFTPPTCTADSGSSSNIANIFAILSLAVAVLVQ